VTGVQGVTGIHGVTGIGAQGAQGTQGTQGAATSQFGNVASVDAIYGNDATASVGGSPYLTVQAAVAAVTSGQTVWIRPGTYTLPSGITIPNGTSLRGLSLQTTTIQMNVTTSTTMITMGENCRVEDLTINLTCTGSTNNLTLIGMQFGGTSSQTSKLRTCVLNVTNSAMNQTLTSNVYGVLFNGSGALTSSSFSFNSLKGSTINIYSNGIGTKRGILVSNSNQASTRDLNVNVAQPRDTSSTGSYVGIETNDPDNTGSIQLRTTTCGVVYPVAGQLYTASDILQTTPAVITNPTYLASAGIQVGPGTDLVTKSAGSKGFSTYVYPLTIYYGLKGDIASGTNNSYLWPGTQAISAGVFPDPTGPPYAYYRCQQPTLISGLYCSVNIAPGSTRSVTWTVRVTPVGSVITNTVFTVTLTGVETIGTFYNGSYRCDTGDQIHVLMSYTGNSANQAHDITVQVDLF
jgi:hypothetical protein